MREWWRDRSSVARALLGALAAIVGLNVVLAVVSTATGGSRPGGPTSSAYATGDDGLAAYAELLAREGHEVERLRVDLDDAGLVTTDTLVLADPASISREEVDAVERFVAGGGRLVAAGPGTAPVLARLLGREGAPAYVPAPVGPARPLVPVPEVVQVRRVQPRGTGGSWAQPRRSLPVVAGRDHVLATVADVGRGRVVMLADASPLQNGLLDESDNAALGIAVAGATARPVRFAEAAHGYGRSTGLDAVPFRWRVAIGAATAALAALFWSRGRRLGPPERPVRELPPPRATYVAAMAATLAKTRRPAEAVQPLREAAMRRLEERTGLAPRASDDEVVAAARSLGSEAAGRVLVAPVGDDRAVQEMGRVLAWLEGASW